MVNPSGQAIQRPKIDKSKSLKGLANNQIKVTFGNDHFRRIIN